MPHCLSSAHHYEPRPFCCSGQGVRYLWSVGFERPPGGRPCCPAVANVIGGRYWIRTSGLSNQMDYMQWSNVCFFIMAISSSLLLGCGPHQRSGYKAGVDSCTCTVADGGTINVPYQLWIVECEVPVEQVVRDCEASIAHYFPEVFADAGCTGNVACPCTATADFGADCT